MGEKLLLLWPLLAILYALLIWLIIPHDRKDN